MDFIASLREEQAQLVNEARQTIELAFSEKRELKAEEKTANEVRENRLNQIASVLDETTKFAKFQINLNKVQLPTDPAGKDEYLSAVAEDTANKFAKNGKLDKEGFREVARQWMRTNQVDRQFATVATGDNSGLLLPKSVTTPIIPPSANCFRAALSGLGLSVDTYPTTAKVVYPVPNMSAGGIVSETASSETENEATFTESITLDPKTFQSGVQRYSGQFLNANNYDFLGAMLPTLEYSKELGLESAVVAAIIADNSLDIVQLDSTSTWSLEDGNDVANALPPHLDFLKAIFLSPGAYVALQNAKGSDGHPIYNLDPENKSVMNIAGIPVYKSSYFEDMPGHDNTVGCVVSFVGFKLADHADETVEQYRESSKPNQTAVNLFAYHSYDWSPSAVVKIKTPTGS